MHKGCKTLCTGCWGLNVKAGYTSRVKSFQGFVLDFMNKGETLEGLKPENNISFYKDHSVGIVEDVLGRKDGAVIKARRLIGRVNILSKPGYISE